ncbi:MAG: hypothetical protein JWQ98_100, partial [Chlorobi bacterium]|nr:hypothetical protein [Chlorobiota bacterium]
MAHGTASREHSRDNPDDRIAMAAGPDRRAGRSLFLVAMLAAAGFAVAIVSRPLGWLLGVVPDDAFYYLQIARHIAASGHSTFDGINPTNGYHPAWMLLMTLCAGFVSGPEALFRCGLAAGFLLHIATGPAIVAIIRRLMAGGPGSERWGWIAGALWLVNPFPLFLMTQGVESPVYLLALALLVLVYLRDIDPHLDVAATPSPLPAGRLVVFGAVLGLAFWGRTEAGVLAVITIMFIVLMLHRRGHSPSALFRAALLTGGAFALVAMPWFIFSRIAVGSFGQDSGGMKMLWGSAERSGLGAGTQLADLCWYLYRTWLGNPVGLLFGLPRILQGVMPLVVCAGLAWMIHRFRHVDGTGPLRRMTAWLSAATLVTGGIYGALFTDSQIWHCTQPGLVLFLLLTGWGIIALSRWGMVDRKGGWLRAIILVGAMAIFIKLAIRTPELYPWQRDVHASQPAFEARVPAGEPIGCFNAGIPAYFSPRRIVNLDGLVNHAVLPYWRAGNFSAYLHDQGIDYIADEEESIRRGMSFSSAPVTLVPLDSAVLTGWSSKYRRLWRSGRVLKPPPPPP